MSCSHAPVCFGPLYTTAQRTQQQRRTADGIRGAIPYRSRQLGVRIRLLLKQFVNRSKRPPDMDAAVSAALFYTVAQRTTEKEPIRWHPEYD